AAAALAGSAWVDGAAAGAVCAAAGPLATSVASAIATAWLRRFIGNTSWEYGVISTPWNRYSAPRLIRARGRLRDSSPACSPCTPRQQPLMTIVFPEMKIFTRGYPDWRKR